MTLKKIDYNEIKKESLLKDLAFLVIEDERFLNKLYERDRVMDSAKRNERVNGRSRWDIIL